MSHCSFISNVHPHVHTGVIKITTDYINISIARSQPNIASATISKCMTISRFCSFVASLLFRWGIQQSQSWKTQQKCNIELNNIETYRNTYKTQKKIDRDSLGPCTWRNNIPAIVKIAYMESLIFYSKGGDNTTMPTSQLLRLHLGTLQYQ